MSCHNGPKFTTPGDFTPGYEPYPHVDPWTRGLQRLRAQRRANCQIIGRWATRDQSQNATFSEVYSRGSCARDDARDCAMQANFAGMEMQLFAATRHPVTNERIDFYRGLAAKMFGVPYHHVTGVQRKKAKDVAFEQLYSPHTRDRWKAGMFLLRLQRIREDFNRFNRWFNTVTHEKV